MVFDSHVHAWGYPSSEHPWVNGNILKRVEEFTVDAAYTADKLLIDMEEAGVDEALVVGYPIGEWTDNWYTVEAAKDDRLSGVVTIDPFASDATDRLRNLMSKEGIIGFRLGAICPYGRMWETFDPDVEWLYNAVLETEFWNVAQETDAIVQILAHIDQLDQVVRLVESYPDLTYLIDHFSHADPNTPHSKSGITTYADLAEYESVYPKVSEVQHRSEESYPYADMHDHVRWFIEKFGRERVIWGADYPNVSDVATYENCVTWLEHVEGLSTADIDWIRGRSFQRALSQ